MGAAVLIGVLVAVRRPAVAGAVVGLGALVKIIGLLALVALAVSVARQAGRRAGATVAAVGAAVVAAGYLVAGGATAILPLRVASQWHTPASLAAAVLTLVPRVDAIAVCQLVVASAVAILLFRGHAEPQWLVVAVVTVYLLGAPYVLPWYTAWVLPAAALAWRSRLAVLIAVQSAAVAIISVDGRQVRPVVLHEALSAVTRTILPALEVTGLVLLVALALGGRRHHDERLSMS